MGNNTHTYQQQTKVSIPRDILVEIAQSELNKKSFKVLLILLSELDGWSPTTSKSKDPRNFKRVDAKQIARTLDMDEDDVRDAIDLLEDVNIIERGRSNVSRKGYRFTF